ncbi:DUF5750 family protein [Methanobrevibacter millerae]|uniref:Uncharacterized protein n=1 Tax=Methanobrevibacter millerae TaxID=230361 RepID=A0A1G5VYM4_9EURY|nr:DUF5750 family protein [Methanobrevibacter millerae]SDA51011.1 hypothetical protein SAMN02910315_01026 [Methanobrevibacter millerae]
MNVKITGFDEDAEIPFIDYEAYGLSVEQMDFLNENLDDETSVNGDVFKIRVYFEEIFPFQSDIAKIRLDDFIAREEIEMNVFLSSFLEDM